MSDVVTSFQHVFDKWEKKGREAFSARPPGGCVTQPRAADTWGGGARITSGQKAQRYRNRETYRNRGKPDPPAKQCIGDILAAYKKNPLIQIDYKPRPIVGDCCSRCNPHSLQCFQDEFTRGLGLSDVLVVSTGNPDRGLITRKCCYFAQVFFNKPKIHYEVITKHQILAHSAVKEAISSAVSESAGDNTHHVLLERLTRKHEARAVKVFNSLAASVSNFTFKLCAWLSFHLLSRLTSSVQIHKGQFSCLRKAADSPHPLVFLPLHSSHMDYILLSFILYNQGIRIPLCAAGNNLNIACIGKLLKRVGAFFIKRKSSGSDGGTHDEVYRGVLKAYMHTALSDGHYMEIFIEGTRTRNGKCSSPKGGLLSNVVSAVTSGCIDDAYIVPVSITYEKIPEGTFIGEQTGTAKQTETLWEFIKGVHRFICGDYGHIRLSVGQPFSLQEYLSSSAVYNARNLSSYSPAEGDTGSKLAVTMLAHHTLYSCSRLSAIMSTQLVSFTLLTLCRAGGTLQQLHNNFSQLRAEVNTRGWDTGFSGTSEAVIIHALRLLGDAVTHTSVDGEMHISPVLSTPHVISLQYYSNHLTTIFAADSIISCCILRLVASPLRPYLDLVIELVVSRQELMTMARVLVDILQYELVGVMTPPCGDTQAHLVDTITRFITQEHLAISGHKLIVQGMRDVHLSLEDDEEADLIKDEQLRVSCMEASISYMTGMSHHIAPLIDSYYYCVLSLYELLSTELLLDEFTKLIYNSIQDALTTNTLHYSESLCLDSIKNCLQVLQDKSVISVLGGAVFLTEEFTTELKLNELLQQLNMFRS